MAPFSTRGVNDCLRRCAADDLALWRWPPVGWKADSNGTRAQFLRAPVFALLQTRRWREWIRTVGPTCGRGAAAQGTLGGIGTKAANPAAPNPATTTSVSTFHAVAPKAHARSFVPAVLDQPRLGGDRAMIGLGDKKGAVDLGRSYRLAPPLDLRRHQCGEDLLLVAFNALRAGYDRNQLREASESGHFDGS